MDFSTDKSPATLQGPRPTPLRVRKDSRKIKKPPVAPPTQSQQIHRPPVIIYTVSPKVIHTNTTEFMTLVQRLTGPTAFQDQRGAVSPAARFASLQKAVKSPDGRKVPHNCDVAMENSGYFPGILSPGPASLPPIPPNFFSPLTNDQNPLSFFHDLSPALHNNRYYNYTEDNTFIIPSPSNLLSPYIISPATQILFNTLFD